MLDPRCLSERRDEIALSCQNRGVRADIDGAIAGQERVNALLTELNDANRRRNEHQKSGKRKLDDAERAAHNEAGRAIKEEVAEIEGRLRDRQLALDAMLMHLPNFVHPDSPVGGEEDFRVVKEGKPTEYDFEPLDHLALAEKHDLVDFETGASVAGQKWYYLKNEAALLDVAL